jgi:MFS family permease
LRLLIIEKKTAAKYDDADDVDDVYDRSAGPDPEGNNTIANANQGSEQEPLLSKMKDEAFKLRSSPSPWIKTLPVISCLSSPRLLVALLVTMMIGALSSTFDATVPVEAHRLYGFDSLRAGLLFIAILLPYLLLSPIAGWTVDRYGPKPASAIGFGYTALALILLRFIHAGGKAQIMQYCAQLALCGIGLAFIGAPGFVEASDVVERYHQANPGLFGENGPYAQLYSLNSMAYSLGLAVGPLISGGLNDRLGYGDMNLVIGVLCLMTAVLAYVFVGGRPNWLRRSPFNPA